MGLRITDWLSVGGGVLPRVDGLQNSTGSWITVNGILDPEDAQLHLVPGQAYRALYRQAQTRLNKISAHLGGLPPFELSELRVVDEAELTDLNERLGELWNECSASEEQAHRTLEDERGAYAPGNRR